MSELLSVEGLTNATAAFAVARYQKLRSHLSLTPYRVAILRSFTVEPVVPILRLAGFRNGLDITVQMGEFNVYAQEILDEASALYKFAPHAVILAVDTRSIAPELWSEYADLAPGHAEAVVERVSRQFGDWMQAFRRHSKAHLIVHELETPAFPAMGVFDRQTASGQFERIAQLNERMRTAAREIPGVYTLDYQGLVNRHGGVNWNDERKWRSVRLPISAPHLPDLAREWMRYLQPLSGRVAKVAVVDLDNTLWGGVIGEDGLAGIQLGSEHPGAAFQVFQRAVLDLTRRGILLAVASKNNLADALDVLEKHDGMLLRPRHFAAMRVNWNDKSVSLREIAAELNLGIDSLAFLDDNPVERQRIREELPEVIVIDLPTDPWKYATTVRECPFFERLALSDEDRHRSDYYTAEKQRVALEATSSTREDFLRSLEQVAEIATVNPLTLARIAQLTQKTNQFNTTTRRYSEQQVTAMADDPAYQVLSIRVKDRYCDNGLVGVAVTKDEGEVCTIDTFLLSCRVDRPRCGRRLSWRIWPSKRGRGGKIRLEGWFLPTKKNAPALEFYPSHGFEKLREEPQGALWALEVATKAPDWP